MPRFGKLSLSSVASSPKNLVFSGGLASEYKAEGKSESCGFPTVVHPQVCSCSILEVTIGSCFAAAATAKLLTVFEKHAAATVAYGARAMFGHLLGMFWVPVGMEILVVLVRFFRAHHESMPFLQVSSVFRWCGHG